MKKVFALILVLILALAVFSSCSKKEEAKSTLQNFKVYNRCGEKIVNLKIGNDKGTSSVAVANIDDGADIEMGCYNPDDGSKLQITVKAGLLEITTGIDDNVTDITIEPNLNVTFSKPGK